MQTLPFYWINVFTNLQNRGNPLPVIILEQSLSADSMQKITTMFNQSETIFIENAQSECPKLHIYTPVQELPFAGHPIIGALEILTLIRKNPVSQVQCKAGIVHTDYDADTNIYWLKAPATPTKRASDLTIELTAKMLGIASEQVLNPPTWMNVGNEQLLVQIKDPATIDEIALNLPLFEQYAALNPDRCIIYLWAQQQNGIYARFLSLNKGILREDSGTGSAAANLGGWLLLQGKTNLEYRIQQGTLMQRESILYLKLQDQEIWIGGENHLLGKGELNWQD